MRIRKVYGRNFLSFQEFGHVLGEGLQAVIGENRDAPGARSNGAGKSSIVDAIAWCLFGETTRGVSGDEVINITAGKGCAISVEFDDGTRVTRHRKDKKRKNTLVIERDGDEVQQDRLRDAQAQVDRMLGMDWSTFRQSVLFGQDAVRFLALTDSEKKEVLERILGLEVLDRAADSARSSATGQEKKAEEYESGSRFSIAKAEGIEREIKARKEAVKRREADRADAIAQVEKEYADSVRQHTDDVKRLRDVVEERRENLVQTSTALPNLTEIEDAARASVKEAEEKFRKALDDQRAAERPVIEGDAELMRLEKEMGRVSLLQGTCPTCLREIEAAYVERAVATLRDAGMSQSAAMDELHETAQKVIDAGLVCAKDLDTASKERETATKARSVAIMEERTAVQSLGSAEAELLRRKEDGLKALEKLQNRLRELRTPTPDSDVKELDRLALEAKSERGAAENSREYAEASKIKGTKYRFWADGFGLRGLRSMMLDGVLPFLEDRANQYLGDLTGGTVRLALSPVSEAKSKRGQLRDAVSVGISSSHGGSLYESLSGGERQRVDVSMALALFDLARTRTGADLGLAVFDEVFERLDDAGCEAVGSLLRRNAPRWGSVLLVTHLDGLLAEVPDRVRIVKEKGVSRIAS